MDDVVLVFDNGSCTSKVGFAGDDEPHTVIPSVIGHLKSTSSKDGCVFDKEYYL